MAALDEMNLLIEEYPEDVSILKMRANIYLEQDKKEVALFDLETASRLAPSDADIFVMEGDIYLQMKEKGKARKLYEKAIELGVPRMELQEKLKECK